MVRKLGVYSLYLNPLSYLQEIQIYLYKKVMQLSPRMHACLQISLKTDTNLLPEIVQPAILSLHQ